MAEPPNSRDQNASPNSGKNNNSANQSKRHWLEYTAVIAVSAAAVVSAVTAGVGIWQASIASDTEKRQLRAYVGVESVRS
jgi:hypothetical protein